MEDKKEALKLYTALVAYPIWWFISASAFTWALLSDSSPIAGLADYSMIIQFLFSLPAVLVTTNVVVDAHSIKIADEIIL